MDGADENLVMPHFQALSQNLCKHMQNGISIQKENSVTAFASSATALKEKFDPYFAESVDLLLTVLAQNGANEYRQFRAQIIEALTLMASSVSEEKFKVKSNEIVNALI